MNKFDSLQRRIVVAFMLLALGGCLFFGVLATVAVEGIEDYLVDDRLASVAIWAVPRHAAKLPVEMPAGLSFYRGNDIPSEVRGLPLGVSGIYVGGSELHVLTGKDANGAYVVVDHASEYDKIEWVVYSTISAGLIGFFLLSMFLGRFVARSIVTPITTLAAAVRNPEAKQALPLLENRDEMGDLARAFAARTEELKRFLDRERFFTGDVSHELRTPLTVIMGAAEIIQSQTDNQPALKAAAERILRTAHDAAESVTVLLLLARAPDLLDAPVTDVAAVVQNEVARSRVILQNKAVEMACTIEEDFTVCARRELLAAAIGNLIRNACQYTEEGSIRVRVGQHKISVEDTGPGIPDSVRASLLGEPQPSGYVGAAGSGLGLALVARICEHLGARLEVADGKQGGAVLSIDFSLTLTKT